MATVHKVSTDEGRTSLFVFLKNCILYDKVANSDTIPDPALFEHLDSQMLLDLESCGLQPHPYMFEQVRHLENARCLDICLEAYKGASRGDDDTSIVPISMLFTFLYDHEMVEKTRTSPKKADFSEELDVSDELLKSLYGKTHSEMKKAVNSFIAVNKKKDPSWRQSTKRFSLDDITRIRKEFFDFCGSIPTHPNEKTKTITVWSQKGGVGKTYISVSLAGALSLGINKNNRVLVIDTDFQESTTAVLKPTAHNNAQKSIFNLLSDYATKLEPDEESIAAFKNECLAAIIPSALPNIDLIPSDRLSSFDALYSIGSSNGKSVIKPNALKTIIQYISESRHYDYVIIDTRPDTATSALLSYTACDEHIMVTKPSGTDILALKAFLLRHAITVLPTLVHNGYAPPKKHRVVINQHIKNAKNSEEMIITLKHALRRDYYEVADTVFPVSVAAAVLSSDTSTMWNVPLKRLTNEQLKTLRRSFVQLGYAIANDH